MPLATDIVSGERADDVLYIPVIERIAPIPAGKEILYVGGLQDECVEYPGTHCGNRRTLSVSASADRNNTGRNG